VIQRLLAEAGGGSDEGLVSVEAVGVEKPADWDNLRSSENYLGHERSEHFAAGAPDVNHRHVYRAPTRLDLNRWALAGEWTVGRESILSSAPSARVLYRFHARDLHLVMGPSGPDRHPVRFRVTIDGQTPGPAHGVDIDEGGNGTVIDQRLYQLIRQPRPIVDHQFAIEFLDAGIEAFSITFG